jgi:hypothetical protein
MEPRKEEKQPQKPAEARGGGRKTKLRLVKLEGRIAPRVLTNHNETLVRDPAKAGPKPPSPREGDTRGCLRLVKLEGRIAPRIMSNHNETLVRDRAACAR